MATLKQRMHKKNSSGTYDTVHLETSSSLVLRPSGRTVEQDLADYLPKTQASDTPPSTLKPSLVVGNTKMWYNRTEVATKEELENVKGMIDVSARLVGVYGYASSETSVSISYNFDYIKIICQFDSDVADKGQMYQESIRYLTSGSECIIYGICGVDTSGYKLSRIRAALNGHTLQFYSSPQYSSNLTAEASVNNITIEAYKYQ